MRTARRAGALLALVPLLHVPAVTAAPDDYVRVPIVVQGEKEIDFKSGAGRFRDGSSGTAASLGFGYGATSWWFTEFYAKWHRPPGEPGGFDAWEWENRFQLTETGRYPVDIGALLEIERPKERSEGYEITYGPLLQSEWGAVQGNLNLLWQKHVRASAPSETELKYQWQLKHRTTEKLEWGAQGFGELGSWDHWAPSSQQQHRLGPAIFGKFRPSGRTALKYNAALLFGTNDASPRTSARLQVEYEFF